MQAHAAPSNLEPSQTDDELTAIETSYPCCPEQVPQTTLEQGRYLLRFARTPAELRTVLQLRFQVFNLELGEGLESSHELGLDVDGFDVVCHHLMVQDKTSGEIVGTYRLQTNDMATAHKGFYSAGEFDLSVLPTDVEAESVELGRACIALSHRNRQVLFLLWKGLALYLTWNRKRYLFGCSSLTSQDPRAGLEMLQYLSDRGHLHPTLVVPPLPGFECELPAGSPPIVSDDVEVPGLFRSYLRYGAKICGAPAIDREFKTIDFFMLFDLGGLDDRRYQIYFDAQR